MICLSKTLRIYIFIYISYLRIDILKLALENFEKTCQIGVLFSRINQEILVIAYGTFLGYDCTYCTVSIPMIQLFPATSILKMNDVNYRPKLHFHQLNELMLISTNP